MNLTTTYMGLPLRNPVVVASSPVTRNADNLRRAADAGAGAAVLFSLFEEQVDKPGAEHPWFPAADDYFADPKSYFDLLRKAVRGVDIPVIGSLNGVSNRGWETYARKIEDAGAQGLELNIYHVASNPDETGAAVEQRHLDILRAVKSAVRIPVALKLSPYFSSFGHMAKQFDEAGADALVLFNRFYQPDFNLEAMEVEATLDLSSEADIRLPLRWIAMLRGRLKTSLAASCGVQSGREVVKFLLAGADAVQTASALLRHGPEYAGTLVTELEHWMKENAYESVAQMTGAMSQKAVPNPEEFERANYLKVIGLHGKQHRAG